MSHISTTLSVITQLKDVIDIATQISGCIAKLPGIYSKSKKYMQDVHETLQKIGAIYTEDMEYIHNNSLLIESMTTLEKDMKGVYEKCVMLIPPVKLKKMDKIKLAFYLFWKREKVEELTLELREHVQITLRLFAFLSNQRIGGTADKVKDILTVALREPSPSNIAEFWRRDIPMLGTASDARLFLFAQTHTTPITWMTGTIPVEQLSRAHLRRELAHFEKSLQSLSVNWFENPPATIDIPPYQRGGSLDESPSSDVAAHRDAIMLIFNIQFLLDYPDDSWIRYVCLGIGRLATILSRLNMREEAVVLSTLRTDIYAATSTLYPESYALYHLAAALTNLSVEFHNIGDKEQSHNTNEEAVRRIESLLAKTDDRTDILYGHLAQILAVEAAQHPAANIALNLAAESVHKIEVAVGINNTTTSHMSGQSVSENDFNDMITAAIERNISHDLLFAYASMLYTLAEMQAKNDMFSASSKSVKQILTVLRHLSKLHPDSVRILQLATDVLDKIFTTELFTFNTITENSEYVQSNVEYLTQLASVNPQRWVLGLLQALIWKRYNRLSTGDVSEAREIHQQILGLGSLAMDNHTNLKIPSETEADYYRDLANYHLLECNCVPDAVHAARNSISQYSALEYMTPGRSPFKHFKMLVFLSRNLMKMEQYDIALAEGFKALKLLDRSSVQGHDPTILQEHMNLLDSMMTALDASFDSRALEWARDINSRISKLFLTCGKAPENIQASAPCAYASILRKNDLLDEAALYLQDALRIWDVTYGQPGERNVIGIAHLRCFMDVSIIFQSIGETDKALHYIQEGMDVAEKYFSEGFDLLKSVFYITMTSIHTILLCDARRCDEALALSRLAITFAHENDQANGYKSGLIQLLLRRAFCQLHLSQPQAAITSSTEAEVICRRALGPSAGLRDKKASILGLLRISLQTTSTGLADSGDMDQALTYLQEAKDTLILEEVAAKKEVGSDDINYMILATNKFRIFFTQGNYEKAAHVIEQEVIEKYRICANSSAPTASAFIKALRYAGILYCTLGRHVEGISAANELRAFRQNVSVKSPKLARLVEVNWRRIQSHLQRKAGQNAKDKLTCNHQIF